MADVVEINDLQELAHYRLVWNALFQQTPNASFFQTYDWFHAFWTHFGHDRQMRVLVVRSGGEPIGIVPLCVVEEKYRLGGLRILTYPLNDWGMSYGPLGRNPTATMLMALRYLHNTPQQWDHIDLRWVPSEPQQQAATHRAMSAVGWSPRKEVYQQSSVISFQDSTWEDYFASLDKKWRHEICRQERRLAQLGEVEFIRHLPAPSTEGDGDPRWDLFEEALEVSHNSWQAQVTDGNTLCHQEVQSFVRDCHRIAARLGMLDLSLLRVNGKPVAFLYNYNNGGNSFGLRMGYHQDYAKYGVGKILLSRFIQDAFQRGDTSLDMGIGDFTFKQRFRTKIETTYHFTYTPWKAWKSQGVRLSHWVRDRILNKEVSNPSKTALGS